MTDSAWLSWALEITQIVLQAVEVAVVLVLARWLLCCGRNVQVRMVKTGKGKGAVPPDSKCATDQASGETGEMEGEVEQDEELEETDPAEKSSNAENQELIKFVVDALFLADSFEFVCGAGRNEVFHYVTGVQVDGTFVLTRIVPVGFSQQSAVYVRVDDRSNIQTLEWLDEWGVALLGHFHSHPGDGSAGTTPSGTDRRFVGRLARGGHIAIGAIFSRNAYVRFYADDSLRFSVEVKGRHVEKVDENVFKLDLAHRRVPIAVHPTERSGRAWGW